ncbi:MAG TPA: RNA methyltransferase [Caulobacteraceae bacterium]|nr:RNA methyltransferase [Caulobacteraceae bacterium]
MASNHQRNDRQRGADRRRPDEARAEWLWGWHTILAALANPARPPAKRLLATVERARALQARFGGGLAVEVAETAAIGQILPPGAVHQGVGLRIPPLEAVPLDELGADPRGILVMLDQVTDPQNIGAVFRSAAAFGARGVIVQDRHAPLLTGALAKAAAGAIDQIPHAREVNLSRALERLERLGWRAVALDGEAPDALADVLDGGPTVLVLGAEGEGVRRLVREHCDALANIPMPGGFESLNVAAAAAIALYEANRPR